MAMFLVAAIATAAAMAGIDARATYGARVTADEPQYLLSAISLGEDLDLDISDEIADRRYLPFHEIGLNHQTIALDDTGREVSPHDPLLPILLAVPMLLGGWVAAKITLALVAGTVAALTLRLAVARFGAPLGPAAAVVAACFAAPPFATYGVQVYPAMPAALLVVAGVIAATAAPSRRTDAATIGVVIALPWLAVKYVPVAAVIALAGLQRRRAQDGRVPLMALAAYAVAGVVYLALHRHIYGGWTVYATGDHFVDGEWLVVGTDPDYVGRSRRLIGLIVDRSFGIAAWNPALLAMVPALAWLVRTRRPGWQVVMATVAAGWATATWVALTMHGWWWPGRQIVPILPLGVAALAAAVGQYRRLVTATLLAACIGSATWLWLAWETSTGRRALVVDFEDTAAPWFRLWRLALPDHRRMSTIDQLLTVGWVAAAAVAAVVVWRRAELPDAPGLQPTEDHTVGTAPAIGEDEVFDAPRRSSAPI